MREGIVVTLVTIQVTYKTVDKTVKIKPLINLFGICLSFASIFSFNFSNCNWSYLIFPFKVSFTLPELKPNKNFNNLTLRLNHYLRSVLLILFVRRVRYSETINFLWKAQTVPTKIIYWMEHLKWQLKKDLQKLWIYIFFFLDYHFFHYKYFRFATAEGQSDYSRLCPVTSSLVAFLWWQSVFD